MATLLVIDDKADEFKKALDVALDEHVVLYASDAEEGLAMLEAEPEVACVLLDIAMPPKLGRLRDEEGLVALRTIRTRFPMLPVLMLTASGDDADMVRALRMGAFYYIAKPPDGQTLRTMVGAAIANRELQAKAASLGAPLRLRDEMETVSGEGTAFGSMVGASPAMRRVFGVIERVAPKDVTVLILGETGTGKELVAREIHRRSGRCRKPFVPVNCANLTGTLLESELFGHRKGAFTDAKDDRRGAFRAAEGGTLFLDEIAEMSAELQSKLLRVLQEQAVKPLGADREETVDVRVVAATNQNLDHRVEAGSFREDLFYRLNVVRIVLPPLRERRDDIERLADHFLAAAGAETACFLSPAARDELRNRSWPGNVRELQNAIQRAVALASGPELSPDDFEPGRELTQSSAGEEALWQSVLGGREPSDINRFAELHGKLALAEMMYRAGRQVRTDREAGRLLGFIPEEDTDDRAFNNYRAWKRRVFRLRDGSEGLAP
jgi:DNA-binding NtrC family response regulator